MTTRTEMETWTLRVEKKIGRALEPGEWRLIKILWNGPVKTFSIPMNIRRFLKVLERANVIFYTDDSWALNPGMPQI